MTQRDRRPCHERQSLLRRAHLDRDLRGLGPRDKGRHHHRPGVGLRPDRLSDQPPADRNPRRLRSRGGPRRPLGARDPRPCGPPDRGAASQAFPGSEGGDRRAHSDGPEDVQEALRSARGLPHRWPPVRRAPRRRRGPRGRQRARRDDPHSGSHPRLRDLQDRRRDLHG